MRAEGSSLRATFVLEQHLGHQTFAENLRAGVEDLADVHATWVGVHYGAMSSRREALAGLGGESLRGALRGRTEVRHGTRGVPADVTFFNTQVPAVLGGRRARGPVYVLCTDITPAQYDDMAEQYGHRADSAGLLARAKHATNRRVFRRAACTVAWSSWVRNSLIRDYGVAQGRVVVIPPGVDTVRWRPARIDDRPRLRVLFVGGDLHRKGGDTLLRAFGQIPDGLAELVLVTRTPHPPSRNVRVENGLSPNTPELIELYRSSDVFVLPSAGEAFGIAAAEAAAAGLPVVATGVGGLVDIVEHGVTGYLIDPGDHTHLAHHLTALARDRELARRMGQAGRRRAEQHFDARTNARRVVDVLRAAAQR